MIATRKKFKRYGNSFIETLENYHIGYIFSKNSINYRMICENFISEFDEQYFQFSFSLWSFEPINSVWSFVKNDYIKADNKVWRDAENNKYIDSGNNADSNNAYTYSTNEVLDENGDVINRIEVKTLKAGLNTEYDIFYNGILLGIVEPQVADSIVEQSMNDITSIV